MEPATEEGNDEFRDLLKKRLDLRWSKLTSQAAAVVVRRYFDLLTDYRDRGVPWECISEELCALGCVTTPNSLAATYARAKKSIRAKAQPLPSSEGGGGQERRDMPAPRPPPEPVAVAPKPVEAPVAQQARPVPLGQPISSPPLTPGGAALLARIEASKARVSEADKQLMHRILDEVPKPEREYTDQLKQLRFWTAPDGRVLDVQGNPPKDIENDPELRQQLQRATVMYAHARRAWLVQSGVCVIGGSGALIVSYKRAEMPPLTIDLAKTVAEHLD